MSATFADRSAVATCTVTVSPGSGAALSSTAKCAAVSAVGDWTTCASRTKTVKRPSGSRMRPTPVSSPSVAPTGLCNRTMKFSFRSRKSSPMIVTETVWVREPPGVNVTSVGSSAL